VLFSSVHILSMYIYCVWCY